MFDWTHAIGVGFQVVNELQRLVAGQTVTFPVSYKGKVYNVSVTLVPKTVTMK